MRGGGGHRAGVPRKALGRAEGREVRAAVARALQRHCHLRHTVGLRAPLSNKVGSNTPVEILVGESL